MIPRLVDSRLKLARIMAGGAGSRSRPQLLEFNDADTPNAETPTALKASIM